MALIQPHVLLQVDCTSALVYKRLVLKPIIIRLTETEMFFVDGLVVAGHTESWQIDNFQCKP